MIDANRTPKRIARQAVEAALGFAREKGIALPPPGGRISQSGQTVKGTLVIDVSRHLNKLLVYDTEKGRVTVQPGLVLDNLNGQLKADGWWYPIDVATASREMVAENSCGSPSIRPGMMHHNVLALEAMPADGTLRRFEAALPNEPLNDGGFTRRCQIRDVAEQEANSPAAVIDRARAK